MDTQTPAAKPAEAVIAELRQRVVSGQPLTREEVREALRALRQNRLAAADAAGSSKRKPSTPARSTTELLAKLKGQSAA